VVGRFPPDGGERGCGGEKLRARCPALPTDHYERRPFVRYADAAAQLFRVGKVRIGLHHLAPRGYHTPVGDRAVNESKDMNRIIVWMKACDPPRTPPPQRERQLRAVSPLLRTSVNIGQIDLPFPDALERIANDPPFRLQLCVVGDVLKLTAAT